MSITVSEDILVVNETLTIDGSTSSNSITSGALIVNGGVGIGADVNVGGDLNVLGDANIETTLTLGIGTTSYTFPAERGSSGQLLTFNTGSGGLEFSSLNVLNALAPFGGDNLLIKTTGVDTNVEATGVSLSDNNDLSGLNSISIDNNTTIGGELNINGTTSSTDNTSGALVIAGGVGVSENLNVGGDVCIDGDVKVNGELTLGEGTNGYIFPTEIGLPGQILAVSTDGSLLFTTCGASPFTVNAPVVFGNDNRLVRTLGTDRDIEATNVIISDTDDISGINTLNVDNEVTIGGVLSLTSTVSSSNSTSGALVVSGGVGIAENLNISGDTNIDGVISINNTTESISTNTGALTVSGGVGIGGDVNIGGTLNADNIILGDNELIIGSTTASNNNTSGALVVSGGVGIGGNTNIGGDTNIDGSLTVNNEVNLNSTASSINNTTGALIISGGLGLAENLNMGGVLNVNNSTGSVDTESGALVVDGGVGIGENLNVGGDINTDGVVNINNTSNSTGTGTGALVVDGGVSISKDLYIGGSLVLNEPLVSNSQFVMMVHTGVINVSSTTFVPLPWNTEVRRDTGLYTHSGNDINVLESGWYKIVANIASEITTGNGSNRTISSARITINGVEVDGSKSFMYNRTALRGHGTCTITILHELTINDTINVEINRLVGTSTITSISNACRLFVSRI